MDVTHAAILACAEPWQVDLEQIRLFFTRTDGTTGTAATVTFASDGASAIVRTITSTGADGRTIVENTRRAMPLYRPRTGNSQRICNRMKWNRKYGDRRAIPHLMQHLQAGPFKGRQARMRMVGRDGKVMVAEGLARSASIE